MRATTGSASSTRRRCTSSGSTGSRGTISSGWTTTRPPRSSPTAGPGTTTWPAAEAATSWSAGPGRVLSGWAGTDSYAARVAGIRAGTGGVPKLDATTVIDDGVPDLLIGGPGRDWFIGTAPPDVFAGIRADELVN